MTDKKALLKRGASDEWGTPPGLFKRLNGIFRFTLDAAATPENALCPRYFTAEQDGLKQSWARETVWLNPPYSQIGKWVANAANEVYRNETTVVMLVAARTDTKWWSQEIMSMVAGGCAAVHLIAGRLTFVGAPGPAPFPSAIVVMKLPEKLDLYTRPGVRQILLTQEQRGLPPKEEQS